MVKGLATTISSLRSLQSSSATCHSSMQSIIDKTISESSLSSNKISIDLCTLEELATIVSYLSSNDKHNSDLIESLSDSSDSIYSVWENFKLLQHDFHLLRSSFENDYASLSKSFLLLQSVHKEFKSRCQSGFLDYLKGVDIDLRKILKPLVPTSVVKEQVKFPMINTNSSLRSSVQSIAESNNGNGDENIEEDPNVKSQPDPAEVTIQKLNSHIQMLVNTLENIAKDLIQVLAEADREYYQLLNRQDVYSRPPTPLAAPLPDYFCYEIQDSPRDLQLKQSISSETKKKWTKRLVKLYENRQIKDTLYKNLITSLAKSSDTSKIDIREIFISSDVSITERENIVYYLLNGTTEFGKNVSISQMVNENKLKPEPPKNPKPKGKPFHKIEKESDKRASPAYSPDLEVARISQALVSHQAKVVNSIGLVSKSPKIERLFKNRKSVRVRSITPVVKEKSSNLKTRTPSVQNNKLSLNAFYAKHRLRRNL